MAGIAKVLSEVQDLLLVVHPRLIFSIGNREIDRHGSPPRIVWVVLGAGHGAAEKIAGRNRSILTRNVDVIAHVWASDIDELELLVDDTISAVHRVAHGSLAFGGEEWPDTDDASSGLVALLKFSISAPVVERKFVRPVRDEDDRSTLVTPTKLITRYDDVSFTERLGLTGHWRDFTGGTWNGTTSAGPSGARALTPVGSGAATSTLNGRGIATLTTAGHFTTGLPLSDFVNASTFSMWALVKIDTVDSANIFVVSDADEYLLLSSLTPTPALQKMFVGNWSDASGDYDDARVDLTLGSWMLLQARFNGSTIQVRANGAPWVTETTTVSAIESLGANLLIGTSAGDATAFSLAEVGITNQRFDDATFDAVRGYTNWRYDLNF